MACKQPAFAFSCAQPQLLPVVEKARIADGPGQPRGGPSRTCWGSQGIAPQIGGEDGEPGDA